MNDPTILTVYGTRPEAIKVAPLLRLLGRGEGEKNAGAPRLRSYVVSTGQHKQMLEQVNAIFGITPDVDLHIMREGQSLNGIVARAITGIDEVLVDVNPDAVVVQGDTSTAMAGAIAAFNRSIPIVHLEAGLRTGNLASPFPEEGNRKIIGQIASLHLAPTATSRANLLAEGIDPADIVVTGNTVIDALLLAQDSATMPQDEHLAAACRGDSTIVMVTTHRRENLDAMSTIGHAMASIARARPEVTLVLPAHLNPKVRRAILPQLAGLDNVIVTDPLSYGEFIYLMNRASIVLTDSGGVQEEAPSLGKPVLVMRDTTERPEAVAAGTVRLVGTNEKAIVDGCLQLIDDSAAYDAMAGAVNPYGDGQAAARSVAAIKQLCGIGQRIADFCPQG